MSFSNDIKEEIEKLKVWDNKSNLKQEEQLERVCVREAFLQYGSFSDPNKEYHLEFVFKTKKKAEEISKILSKNGIKAKIIKRREKQIVYLKEGEDISNCLAFMGASSAMLRFEEIRVMREMRNNVNRKVNCETANLTKTVHASYEQVKAINVVKKTKYWKELEDGVRDIALLRLENPELSIQALGSKLTPPISKSGANHRLKKIMEIAREIEKK